MLPTADGFTVGAFVGATARMTGPRRYVALVPTQVWRLVAGPPEGLAALASYDAVLVGGAPLDDGLAAAAISPGARIVRSYGMTETCGGCVYDGRAARRGRGARAGATARSRSADQSCSPATGSGRT